MRDKKYTFFQFDRANILWTAQVEENRVEQGLDLAHWQSAHSGGPGVGLAGEDLAQSLDQEGEKDKVRVGAEKIDSYA